MRHEMNDHCRLEIDQATSPIQRESRMFAFLEVDPPYQFSYINPQFFPSRFSVALGYVCACRVHCAGSGRGSSAVHFVF